MPTLQLATVDDAAVIARHRVSMFADNRFASPERLAEMAAAFEPWVRQRLHDGRYVGLLAVEEDGSVVAGGGIFFGDFPPHFLHLAAERPYLLNFYTAPEARGRGLARQILEEAIRVCRERGAEAIVLHASPFGRPIYTARGFTDSGEMMLRLE